jgi:hypothetical protein
VAKQAGWERSEQGQERDAGLRVKQGREAEAGESTPAPPAPGDGE